LSSITGLSHHEAFEAIDIEFDSQLRLAVVPIARIFHGAPEKLLRRAALYKKREVDALRSLIRILHVSMYMCSQLEIKDTQGIVSYTFDTVTFADSTWEVVFRTTQPFYLRLCVSKIQLEYAELNFAGKAYITRGCFGGSRLLHSRPGRRVACSLGGGRPQ
jgi:hypothetical protein